MKSRFLATFRTIFSRSTFENGTVETCKYTGDKLEITEDFLRSIENRILGSNVDAAKRGNFRKSTQKEYTSHTLTQEMMLEGKPMTDTKLYESLYERYVYNLKEKVLDPFIDNENFRRAIKDLDTEDFKTYSKRIRDDITFLMNNLCAKYHYTRQSAKEVCIYVMDRNLSQKFAAR